MFDEIKQEISNNKETIIHIKVSALRNLCGTLIEYEFPTEPQKIQRGILSMLKVYSDEELIPLSINIYEKLLLADKYNNRYKKL